MLISQSLEISADRYPDRLALVFDEENRSLTFSQLQERSRRLGNAISSITAHGDRVAILAQNCPEYVEAYWGVTSVGRGLTLLNYRLTKDELAGILTDAEPTAALVEAQYLNKMREMCTQVPSIQKLIVIGEAALSKNEMSYDSWIATFPASLPVETPDDREMAILIYTSGTTGKPKGAMLSHNGIMQATRSWLIHVAQPIASIGCSMMPFPMCHMAGIGAIIDLSMGGTIILQRAFEPVAVMTAIDRHKAKRSPFAPTMLNMILKHPRCAEFDLSSLSLISYGSASMPVELLKAAMERLPNAKFAQGFGMTETSGNVLCLDPDDHMIAASTRPELLATAGRPSPFIAVKLVDEKFQKVVPGEVGEIVMKSDSVMMGYWRRDDANAESFTDGWFHTGDMGCATEDGYIAIVDRKKDMIITGGENVYSREVEEIIYRHPGIQETAVIGLPDPVWGETVCAVVTKRSGYQVSADEILEICRKNLAGYKKPKQVIFVDEMPHTASGKIQKKKLRQAILETQEQ